MAVKNFLIIASLGELWRTSQLSVIKYSLVLIERFSKVDSKLDWTSFITQFIAPVFAANGFFKWLQSYLDLHRIHEKVIWLCGRILSLIRLCYEVLTFLVTCQCRVSKYLFRVLLLIVSVHQFGWLLLLELYLASSLFRVEIFLLFNRRQLKARQNRCWRLWHLPVFLIGLIVKPTSWCTEYLL